MPYYAIVRILPEIRNIYISMKHLTLSIALACSALSLNAQQAEPFLSPQVQRGQLQTKYITSPKSFKLTVDAKRQNTYPMRNIASWVSLSAVEGEGFPLVLGVRGDKSVRSVEKLIPQKTEAIISLLALRVLL